MSVEKLTFSLHDNTIIHRNDLDENSIMMDSCECEIIVNDDNAEDIECRQYMNNGLGPCGSRSGMLDYFFVFYFITKLIGLIRRPSVIYLKFLYLAPVSTKTFGLISNIDGAFW